MMQQHKSKIVLDLLSFISLIWYIKLRFAVMYLGMEQQSRPPKSESPLPPNQNNNFQSTQKMISAVPKQILENYSHNISLNTTQRLLKIEMGNKGEQIRLEAQNESPENREKEEQLPMEGEELFIELHKLNDRCKLAQGLDGKQKNQEIKKILESLVKLPKIQQATKKEQLSLEAQNRSLGKEGKGEQLPLEAQNRSLQKEAKEEQLAFEGQNWYLEKEEQLAFEGQNWYLEKEEQLPFEVQNWYLEKEGKEEQLPFEVQNWYLEKVGKEEQLPIEAQNRSLGKEGKEGCLIEAENNRVAEGKLKLAEELQLSNNKRGQAKYILLNNKQLRQIVYLKLRAFQKVKQKKLALKQAKLRFKESRLAQQLIEHKYILAADIDCESRETQYYETAFDISTKLVKICADQRTQCQAKLSQEQAKIAQIMKKYQIQ